MKSHFASESFSASPHDLVPRVALTANLMSSGTVGFATAGGPNIVFPPPALPPAVGVVCLFPFPDGELHAATRSKARRSIDLMGFLSRVVRRSGIPPRGRAHRYRS